MDPQSAPGPRPGAGGSSIERKAASAGSGRVTVIEPSRGWRALDVRELWTCRELLGLLVLRDLRVRYRQTFLGPLWVVARPLATMAVFTLVFGLLVRVPTGGDPYAAFVLAGLLPWMFFSSSVTGAGNALVGSAGLVGKVYFPRLLIPLSALGGGLVDLAVSFVLLVLLLPLFGIAWTPLLLAAPLLVLPMFLLAAGFGALFAALNVAWRDFGSAMGFLMQAWMFATPVVYPSRLVPGRWRWVLDVNPMAGLVEGFRAACLGASLDLPAIGTATVLSALAFAVGVAYFGKVERRFADII